MEYNPSIKQRLGYIDALRGFSMFLVVLGHVSLFTLHLNSPFAAIFMTFRMPLFFFISGFIGYKALEFWTTDNYVARLKKKAFVQLVPMIIFSFLYAFVRNKDYCLYLTEGFREFWFTFVLLQMFILYYTISLFSKHLGQGFFYGSLVVINIAMIAFLALADRSSSIWTFLCLENLFKYFQFFTLGVLCKRHLNKFLNIISTNSFLTFTIAGFVCLLCILSCDSINPLIYHLGHDIVIRYIGVLMIFAIFLFLQRLI